MRKSKKQIQTSVRADIGAYVSRVLKASDKDSGHQSDVEMSDEAEAGEETDREEPIEESIDKDTEEESNDPARADTDEESDDGAREGTVEESNNDVSANTGEAPCILCGLTEEDDEGDEQWIECSKCLGWLHTSCLLPRHPYTAKYIDFLCPECCIKKPRKCL